MNAQFHPDWLDPVILGVLPAVAILQWVVIVPLAKMKGCIERFEEDADQALAAEVEKPIPFLGDIFFIAWNILPLALLLVYCRLWSDWSAWGATVELRIPAAASVGWLDWVMRAPGQPAAHYIIVAVALYSCIHQFKKVRDHEREKIFLYWWDHRISKTIFGVRLVALFFNVYTLLYVIMKMVSLSIHAVFLPYAVDVVPALGHADGFAGFAPYGQICLWLAFGYLVTSAIMVLGFTDHIKQGGVHRIADILVTSLAAVAAFAVLVFPAARVHKLVGPSLVTAREAIEPQLVACAKALPEATEAACGIAWYPELTQAVLQTKAGIGILDFDLIFLVATAVVPVGWQFRPALRKFVAHRASRSHGNVDDAVAEALPEALDEALPEALPEALDEALPEALDEALPEALDEALDEVLDDTVEEAVEDALEEVLDAAVAEAVADALADAETSDRDPSDES